MSGAGDPGAPEPFHTKLEPHRDTIVVGAHGEVDLATAGVQLREVLQAGFTRVVLDLREVSFVDSTGLRVFIEFMRASRIAGVDFAILQGPGPVQKLFELTHTEDAFRFIDRADIERSWA